MSFTPLLPLRHARTAGGEYVARHVQALASAWAVTVVSPDAQGNGRARDGAVPDGIAWRLVPHASDRSSPVRENARKVVRALRGFSMGGDIESAIRADPEIAELVRRSDLVEFQWAQALNLLLTSPELFAGKRTVLVVHDVYEQLWTRNLELARGPRKLYAGLRRRIARRFERRAFASVDLVLALSEKDRALIQAAAPTARVEVVNPPLDDQHAVQHEDVGIEGRIILFTGAMDSRRNDEAALWFVQQVWPTVRAAVPDAVFVVAGSGPSEELQAAGAADPRVTVTGFTEDIDAFYAAAELFVAPIMRGSGVKFKVITAMLNALPVVSTPVAAEGIGTETDYAAITADSADFAAAVIRVLESPDAYADRAREVQARARGIYGTEAFRDRLLALYASVIEDDAIHARG